MLAPAAVNTEVVPVGEPSLEFDALYGEYFDFVWRNLRRLGVPDSALRDAAQEVFIVVHRRLGEFVPRGTLRSWIYSILRRVAHSQRRQYHRYVTAESGVTESQFENLTQDALEGRCSDPESDAAHGQALKLMLRLLDGLDDDKRDALVIVDIEGMSVPEACVALDVNPNTLYSRLRSARQEMRHRYEHSQRDEWRLR